jgi:glycerate kinase
MLVAGAIEAPADAFEAAASLSELAGGSATAIADPLTWARGAGAALAARA